MGSGPVKPEAAECIEQETSRLKKKAAKRKGEREREAPLASPAGGHAGTPRPPWLPGRALGRDPVRTLGDPTVGPPSDDGQSDGGSLPSSHSVFGSVEEVDTEEEGEVEHDPEEEPEAVEADSEPEEVDWQLSSWRFFATRWAPAQSNRKQQNALNRKPQGWKRQRQRERERERERERKRKNRNKNKREKCRKNDKKNKDKETNIEEKRRQGNTCFDKKTCFVPWFEDHFRKKWCNSELRQQTY